MTQIKISTLEAQLQPIVRLVAAETSSSLIVSAKGMTGSDRARLYRLLSSAEAAIAKLSDAVVSATTLAARGL